MKWNATNCEDFDEYSSPFISTKISEDESIIYPTVNSFEFGESVEHIPAYLCHGMNNLKEIYIPASISSIGKNAFFKCDSITNIIVLKNNKILSDTNK